MNEHQRPNRAPARPLPPPVDMDVAEAPKANPQGSVIAVICILIALVARPDDTQEMIARYAAYIVGIGIAISTLFDLKSGGIRNLIRPDLLAIFALYFLTLFEFLVDQKAFNNMVTKTGTINAVQLVLLAFLCMITARHLVRPKRQPFRNLMQTEIAPGWLIAILFGAFFLGFAHQWVALAKNSMLTLDWWFSQMAWQRFGQVWQRGRLGGIGSLFYELGMLINLIPPLCGIIYARRKRYGVVWLCLISIPLLITFYYGFAGGTRNIFATYIVTFMIGYAFAAGKDRNLEVGIIAACSAVLLLVSTVFMLKFRDIGLYFYWKYGIRNTEQANTGKALFVDYNLYVIANISEIVPDKQPYLGWEIPYIAAIRPIPRAFWKGKPQGLSTTIESVVGAGGGVTTVAASFVGEAYLWCGMIGVIAASTFFSLWTSWWAYLFSQRNSELGILIYASGFFSALISMRSFFMFTTALLPTIGAAVMTYFLVKMSANKVQALLTKRRELRAMVGAQQSRRPLPPNRRPQP